MKHKLKVGILFFSILFWSFIGHASLRDSCASRFQRLSIGKSIDSFLKRVHLRKSSPPLKKKEKSVNNPASLVNGGHLVNGKTSSIAQTSKKPQLEQKPVDLDALLRLAEQNALAIAELEKQTTKNALAIAELKEQSAKTDQQIERTDQQIERTDQQIAKNTQGIAELKEQTARTDQRIAESNERTDQQIAESNKRTDQQIAESNKRTDQQIAESNKRTDQLVARIYTEIGAIRTEIGQFTNRLGFFVESLFGDIDLLFKEIGIVITDVRSRLKRQNDDGITKEFDIVGIGEKYIVLVETKTSLKTSDIVKFLETLEIARSFFPEYPGRKIIGAMGFVFSVESDRKFATTQGLYLIRPKNNSAFIINPAGFHPKEFN